MRRPVTQETLLYELSPSGDGTIEFRTAKLVVHAVDGNRLDYTVLSGLRPEIR